jgi:hypothetical protein
MFSRGKGRRSYRNLIKAGITPRSLYSAEADKISAANLITIGVGRISYLSPGDDACSLALSGTASTQQEEYRAAATLKNGRGTAWPGEDHGSEHG